ncbi:roadblock/LC7 domain-containing protein [Streptomyces sp. CB01881]|uniref:roadblock/LC7 domain-containing protein n=1 Tax=Streptomyces sp. CB01881 TaxID=2078691 RepID=UPI0011DFA8AE|nr:roadblock/LC7 domain-containing protein [Streptomyces sp. CB01881]TYC68221.1 roadblock/LC7 domain-containing protein [Streptomyces sp. CB01881]
MTSPSTHDLDWLLNDFAARVPEITHAVAVSADGLLIAATKEVDAEHADQLAAIASGLVSLLAGAGRLLKAEPVISNLTELQGGFLFSMAVSSGASLLVLASKVCDIGQVSFEMAELINQVGPQLTPAARAKLLDTLS